jgi:hypothetical protein
MATPLMWISSEDRYYIPYKALILQTFRPAKLNFSPELGYCYFYLLPQNCLLKIPMQSGLFGVGGGWLGVE